MSNVVCVDFGLGDGSYAEVFLPYGGEAETSLDDVDKTRLAEPIPVLVNHGGVRHGFPNHISTWFSKEVRLSSILHAQEFTVYHESKIHKIYNKLERVEYKLAGLIAREY